MKTPSNSHHQFNKNKILFRALIRVNTDKGKFMITFGAILFGISLLFLIIFSILTNNQTTIKSIINTVQITLLGQKHNLLQVGIIFLVIYLWKVIDGFFEGIPITIIDIIGLYLIYAFVFKDGLLEIQLNLGIIDFFFNFQLGIIFLIILFGYLWVFVWEIIQLPERIHLIELEQEGFERPEKNKKKNEEEQEKEPIIKTDELNINENWIDRSEEKILFEKDEIPLISEWRTVTGEFQQNWRQFYLYDTLLLIAFGVIYALITYIIKEPEGPYYDATVTAFFFPLWLFLITAFKSIAHYIRAVVAYLISINIQIVLFKENIITIKGIFLIGSIIYIGNFFFYDLGSYFFSLGTPGITNVLTSIMSLFFLIQLGILVLYYIFRKLRGYDRFQILISSKYFYLRKPRSYNYYNIIFDFLMAWMWPLNISIYKDIWNEYEYVRNALNESWKWDYGRVSYQEGFVYIQKHFNNKLLHIILALIFFSLGLIFIYFQNWEILAIIIFITLRQVWHTQIDTIDFNISFQRKNIQGSVFMLNYNNILRLYGISRDDAALIPAIQSYN